MNAAEQVGVTFSNGLQKFKETPILTPKSPCNKTSSLSASSVHSSAKSSNGPEIAFPLNDRLFHSYTRALENIGGKEAIPSLLDIILKSVSQRSESAGHSNQRVKCAIDQVVSSTCRKFLRKILNFFYFKLLRVDSKPISLDSFTEIITLLSCVLSEPQVEALFGYFDTTCCGKHICYLLI